MSERTETFLVVCSGERVSAAPSQVIANFAAAPYSKTKLQFVMRDWLDEEQFLEAALLWIVDDSAPWQAVHLALRNRIPLLASEDNTAMKQLCVMANCGLFFNGVAEAASCLSFLSTNMRVCQRLGENGHDYLSR